jgi:hypothetical protein
MLPELAVGDSKQVRGIRIPWLEFHSAAVAFEGSLQIAGPVVLQPLFKHSTRFPHWARAPVDFRPIPHIGFWKTARPLPKERVLPGIELLLIAREVCGGLAYIRVTQRSVWGQGFEPGAGLSPARRALVRSGNCGY